MNRLVIDTAGVDCRIGVVRQDGQHFLRTESAAQSHSRCILSTIDTLLHEAMLQLSDVQLLVWNAGPGSFTGIRIAASVVQSLSYSLQIPFLSLSSLEILAHAALTHNKEALFIDVAMDARMNGMYWARFAVEQGALVRVEEDRLMTQEAFLIYDGNHGDGMVVAGDAWSSAAKQPTTDATLEDLIALSQLKSQQHWQYRAEDCLPHYVQSSIGWQKRQRFQTR